MGSWWCGEQPQGLLWRHLGLPGGRAGQLRAHTWEPGVLRKPRGHQARGLRSLDKRGHGGAALQPSHGALAHAGAELALSCWENREP